MNGAARLDVSPELLHELLRLPTTATIIDASYDDDISCVSLTVRDESFEEVDPERDHERKINAAWIRQEPVVLSQWELRP